MALYVNVIELLAQFSEGYVPAYAHSALFGGDPEPSLLYLD